MLASSECKERIYNEIGCIAKIKNRRKLNNVFKHLGRLYTDFFCFKLQERRKPC